MFLSEYKDAIGTAAAVTTTLQILAPSFICRDIIKFKSTQDIDYMPFVGGMTMSILTLQHGLILKDNIMVIANVVGIVLNTVYLGIYYSYSHDKQKFRNACSKAALLCAVLVGYANVDSPKRVDNVLGVTLTIMIFSLIGAPLLSVGEIIRKKSTAGLPFPMIASGTVVTFLWLLYGLAIDNVFMIFQNVITFSLVAFQLSLFAIYPSKPSKSAAELEKKKE